MDSPSAVAGMKECEDRHTHRCGAQSGATTPAGLLLNDWLPLNITYAFPASLSRFAPFTIWIEGARPLRDLRPEHGRSVDTYELLTPGQESDIGIASPRRHERFPASLMAGVTSVTD